MPEFDYQWANLPSVNTEHTTARISEFLDLVKLPREFFKGKRCLDAGCGNGRWTYAMQMLRADVDSFDISPEAVEQCRKVNPRAEVYNILDLDLVCNPFSPTQRWYDFVLCWGVLHHLENPELGFMRVANLVKHGGTLHVMVYHKKTQKVYEKGRSQWAGWSNEVRLAYCRTMAGYHGGDIHGWWDAFNPTYNWSYDPKEVKTWFETYDFKKIKLTHKYSINMRGVYRG
jgi:2-polyprenyl-3-methyl-5-hydroxy-6-metoxy-1,4-benzoquinol methylase